MTTHSEDLVSLDELRTVLNTHAGPPSPRTRPTPDRLRRLPLIALAVGVAAALSAGGLALAESFGPLHGAKLLLTPTTLGGSNGPLSTCDLLGKTAKHAEAQLGNSGIAIEWRFMRWGTITAPTAQGSPGAVTGGESDTVSTVPENSVVWDVVPDGQARAFVFVEAPNDPNAPTISTNCAR